MPDARTRWIYAATIGRTAAARTVAQPFWAEQRAKERGILTKIFKPNLTNLKDKGDMVKRYYARNRKIAEECDVLIAFVSSDRSGGTENTIKYARELKKTIIIMR